MHMSDDTNEQNLFPDWYERLKEASKGEPHFRLQDLESEMPKKDWERFEKWIWRQTMLIDEEGCRRVFAWDLRRWIVEGLMDAQNDSTWD